MAKTTKEVAVRKNQAVGLPRDVLAEMAEEAKNDAAKQQTGSTAFSLRGGILAYDGNPMPGNEMEVVVLAHNYEHALFEGAFDPATPRSPVCFAIGDDKDNLAPHINSLKPQSDSCAECPMGEWESDPRPGSKGKACKQTRRLAVMPSDALDDLDNIGKAQVAMLRLPPTSEKNWAVYIQTINATDKRPPWAVVTDVKVSPHPKNQFQVNFDKVDVLDDMDELQACKDNVTRAKAVINNPYSKAEEVVEPPPRKGKAKF